MGTMSSSFVYSNVFWAIWYSNWRILVESCKLFVDMLSFHINHHISVEKLDCTVLNLCNNDNLHNRKRDEYRKFAKASLNTLPLSLCKIHRKRRTKKRLHTVDGNDEHNILWRNFNKLSKVLITNDLIPLYLTGIASMPQMKAKRNDHYHHNNFSLVYRSHCRKIVARNKIYSACDL